MDCRRCGEQIKGEHKKQYAYEAHTACDEKGFILETVVTPGNVHDSVAFDEVYDKVTERFPEVEAVITDTAYKTPHICKKVFDDGRVLSTGYKRPQTMKGGYEWWKFVYDEYYDCGSVRNTRYLNMRPQTGTATGNTRAIRGYVPTVLPEISVLIPKTVSRRNNGTSEKTMKSSPTMHGTRQNTRSSTRDARKR